VTVAGLLTGQDIIHALTGKRIGNLVLVPAGALKQDTDVFLDNMRLEQVEQALGVSVVKVGSFREILSVLRDAGRESR
jgi:NifB/MoaA-like Fe-S oxidoreductase